MSTTPAQADALFDSALYHAAMRAHYLRAANTDTAKRRSHLHAARRHEWCVVNLAVKAEVQSQRLADAQADAARDAHGFSLSADVIGAGYVSATDAGLIGKGVMASHSACQARLQALRGQLASLRQCQCQCQCQCQPTPACAGQPPAQAAAHAPACADGAPAPHTHCAAPCVPCAGLESQPPAPQSQPAQWGESS
ncbi:MAG: hypothetical protein Q7K57_08790 [Burkholderiaceae bacterium]|nr:hypothetical protein [Burkholderiaceae bacterium]